MCCLELKYITTHLDITIPFHIIFFCDRRVQILRNFTPPNNTTPQVLTAVGWWLGLVCGVRLHFVCFKSS